MAEQHQENLIVGVALIAGAILLYEAWRSGALHAVLAKLGSGQTTAQTQPVIKQITITTKTTPAPASAQTPAASSGGSITGSTYTVQRGDTLWGIAQRAGVSLQALEAANPQITNPNLIYPGQTVTIPAGGTLPSAAQSASVNTAANQGTSGYTQQNTPARVSTGSTYTVQRGDTLWGIAQRYGVSLQSLEAANPQIANPNLIYPGQTVNIPAAGVTPSAAPSSSGGGGTYTVRRGDTLWGIAMAHGLSLQQLERLNPQITNPNLIYPGEEVHL
jgi:spore coat assembly protein SafA